MDRPMRWVPWVVTAAALVLGALSWWRFEARLAEVEDALAKTAAKPVVSRVLPAADPAKTASLEQVLAATVYIKNEVRFREDGTNRYLHREGAGAERLRPIGDPAAVQVARGETGSGFCVSDDGLIVTCAHVVRVRAAETSVRIGNAKLVREHAVRIVFSGEATRRTARVVRIIDDGDNDFAVLKIEPFDGMPWVRNFRVDVEPPPPGSGVRLFGFPLGKNLRQEEGHVSGSIFAGMVSRRIEPFVQVQGVVYPGLSGGPMVDGSGRVVGVVSAVQETPTGQIASDIGFVLPIRRLEPAWRAIAK